MLGQIGGGERPHEARGAEKDDVQGAFHPVLPVHSASVAAGAEAGPVVMTGSGCQRVAEGAVALPGREAPGAGGSLQDF
ncbi:hypothetical protein GCM10010327_62480 [Streptomyces nitrosporeus]|nr:hypothetical protein GCM10010327_62480 [Streptomyces nitrosporeus]